MSASLGRIWAIALNTLREAVRNRVFAVLVLFTVALVGFSLVLGELALHENVRVTKDLGLAGISFMSTVIALFLGASLLRKELDRKTVYFVIPKPLVRWEFLLGKYVGLAVTLALLVGLMSLIVAGTVAIEGGRHGIAMIRAEVLVLLEVWLLTAVAMLFSSFSSPYLSAMFAAGLWVIGRNTLELRTLATHKLADTPSGTLLEGLVRVVPDFHLFYVSGQSIADDTQVVTIHEAFVGWGYVLQAGLYAGLYGGLCLALACILFARRDLT